jgi:dolichol-phosphate mannosyltransferase
MSTQKLDLTIVVPVFNEEGAVETVLTSWAEALAKLDINYEIHAYDDGSTDSTPAQLAELESRIPQLVAHQKLNSGHGSTIRQAYLEFAERADWIFQVDSDDEMGPAWFYKLWNIRSDHNFVIGRRYERKSSFARKIVSLSARLSVNLFYGPCIYDVNVPYRLMNSITFLPCFRSIPEETFAPNVLIAGYAAYHEVKTVEIHVPHQSRYSGQVSIRKWKLLKESIRSYFQTIKYRFTAMPIAR